MFAEKIGTSNYFWSFSSQAAQVKKRKLEDIESEIVSLKKRKSNNGRYVMESQ